MVFAFRKNQHAALNLEKLELFQRLLQEHSPSGEAFLASLPAVVKIAGGQGAAVYLYESKTAMFVLKHWVGTKPARFSISADYEFVNYLKVNQHAVNRSEFVKKSHELRQAALFFFQQTCANRVYPIYDGMTGNKSDWLGFVTFDFDETGESSQFCDAIMNIYCEQIKHWILYLRIEEKNKKLSEVGHVKNQLLANVTHELQTPLNGILGITEGILDGIDGELPESLADHLRLIHKSGKELHATVNNILKLTHIEASKDDVKRERVKILLLISEVAALFQQTFAEKAIVCELPAPNKDCDVFVEPDQIRTVLMNLFGNAIKFTHNGKVSITLQKSGEMLHVCFIDTGIGIDNDKLDLIFEEFYQADGSHTRVYGGTGLGLAIVKKIVTLHGGRIWADSKKGEGTKLTFTLPLFPL